jgi:hypothetical protein
MPVFVKRWFITIFNVNVNVLSCSVKVGMKLLNTETPVTRNFISQILLNVQDFYFHKVGYTSYDEGIFGPQTELTTAVNYTNILSSILPRITSYADKITADHQCGFRRLGKLLTGYSAFVR